MLLSILLSSASWHTLLDMHYTVCAASRSRYRGKPELEVDLPPDCIGLEEPVTQALSRLGIELREPHRDAVPQV